MSVLEHLSDVIADLLRDDPQRVVLGEDVVDGGPLGLTRKVATDPTLSPRLLPTPLVPTAAVAYAAGVALTGARPLLLLPSATALLEGAAGLREASMVGFRTGGHLSVPLLCVVPTGPGFGLGTDGSEIATAIATTCPGLSVFTLGRATEAGARLRAAAAFEEGDGPRVLLAPRSVLVAAPDPDSYREHPDATGAAVVRTGTSATVFAIGETVGLAVEAVAQSGIDAAVVEVSRLAPLDTATLLDAARRTGKIVITHAGPPTHGLGAELAGLFADQAILSLDAPVLRVAGADSPQGPDAEGAALPTISRIAAAVNQVATY